jgi:DNA-binding PadR family transcriptional regulator
MTFRGEILDRQKALAEKARKALLESNETAFTLNGEPFTHLKTLRIVEELCLESYQRMIPLTRRAVLATGLGGLIAFLEVPYLGGLGLLAAGLGGLVSFMMGLCASSTKFKLHYYRITDLSKQNTKPPYEEVQKALERLKKVGLLEREGSYRGGIYTLTPLGRKTLRELESTQNTSHPTTTYAQPLGPPTQLEAKAAELLRKVETEPSPSLLETMQQELEAQENANPLKQKHQQ